MDQTYVVKKGDTLYGISNQFGVSVTDLIKLNNLSGSSIQVDQVLQIPSISGTNPSNVISYIVKKGDSLYSIAQKYNTTVSEIVSLNNLKSNNLSIGQILKIPEKYESINEIPSYKNYIVKKGDTLYKIAQENNVAIDTLVKDNSLNSNILSVGQIIKIRTYDIDANTYEECFGSDYIEEENASSYEVKKGDSLYSIARKYNTTVSEIMRLNNLTNNTLSIGQVLKLPLIASSTADTYIVKKGDSLYSIARKYNTTVDNIKRKNNLVSNMLSIGQILYI